MKKYWTKILILIIVIMVVLIGYLVFNYAKKATENIQNPVVTMEIQDMGTVKMELYPNMAPNTVSNFIKLTQNGYYNGLTFHRVVKDFMIQGGDKKGDGTGTVTLKDLYPNGKEDKEYNIKGEFVANNYNNNKIRFERGVLAMARADYQMQALQEQSYNSAGAQFFIVVSENSGMNGIYTAFGKVIEGMDIIDQIANLETKVETDDEGKTSETSTPVNPPVITKMTVDTFGVDYGYPETMDAFDYTQWFMNNYGSNLNLN